jgi:tRNA(fMet)-specific endonuclease VapC
MLEFMLDTDTCSYLIKQRPISVLKRFKAVSEEKISISVVTFAELIYGVELQAQVDLMIAAHALSKDMVVVTNNTRHFERVPQLRIENWVSET